MLNSENREIKFNKEYTVRRCTLHIYNTDGLPSITKDW